MQRAVRLSRFRGVGARWSRPATRSASHSSLAYSGLPFEVHAEVAEALASHRPVVALETAIVTHGLPHPTSVSLPLTLERIVRDQGAVPAHIGIVKGKIKIGLELEDLEVLADPLQDASKRWKVGRREIAGALVQGVNGGTTVSGTMLLAHLAGIKVFVTGGIGGVHRGATTTLDVSSDLTELAKTPVAVVCAGAKSILDIGLTLEYLETQGVPVATFGPSRDFPAFYTPRSGFQAPMNFTTAAQCASMIHFNSLVSESSGSLFGVPTPPSEHSKGEKIQAVVEQAVRESEEQGVSTRGKEVTPWLLARVKELTGGLSVAANIALIKNNARVGSHIAVELAKLEAGHASPGDVQPTALRAAPALRQAPEPAPNPHPAPAEPTRSASARLLVVGSAAVDVTLRPSVSDSFARTTVPGTIALDAGGVARNIAESAYRLGVDDVALAAPIGTGRWSDIVRESLKISGLRTDALIEGSDRPAAAIGMLLSQDGDLVGGVADAGIVETVTAAQIDQAIERSQPEVVCLDGNLAVSAIQGALSTCLARHGTTSIFEPVSEVKALRVLPALSHLFKTANGSPVLDIIVPNLSELRGLFEALRAADVSSSLDWFRPIDAFDVGPRFRDSLDRRLPKWAVGEGAVQMAIQLLPAVRMVMVKSGGRGVVVVGRIESGEVSRWKEHGDWIVSDGGVVVQHFPAFELPEGTEGNVTGAGDTLCGAISASLVRGMRLDSPADVEKIVELAQRAALETLKSKHAVGDLSSLRL